jgi:hypothetical protein
MPEDPPEYCPICPNVAGLSRIKDVELVPRPIDRGSPVQKMGCYVIAALAQAVCEPERSHGSARGVFMAREHEQPPRMMAARFDRSHPQLTGRRFAPAAGELS